ncbi:hypothetical protein JCM12298_11660 [Desulfothermus naphthae]
MAEKRYCPYCHQEMEYWLAPPETGWGYIYVCFNNQCTFYRNSSDNILNKGEDQRHFAARYGEDPANNFHPINILAYNPFVKLEEKK